MPEPTSDRARDPRGRGAPALQINDPRRPLAIDPVTRADMEDLDRYPTVHWITLYNSLVMAAQIDPVLASTLMAHLSHGEVRYMLGFLVGNDAAAGV